MSFRFITKSIHAYLIDYPVAIVLIAASRDAFGIGEGHSRLKAAMASSRVETLPMFVREGSGGRAVLLLSWTIVAFWVAAIAPARIQRKSRAYPGSPAAHRST
jgi:hypothetical protein